MTLPQVSIDISSGAISLGGIDAQELLSRLHPEQPKEQGKYAHIGDGLLGDIPVSLHACRKPYVFQVAVKPPIDLDFQQSDQRAREICGAVMKLADAAPKPFWPKRSWGSVTLLSEWRDGGWGAFFDIAQRT